MVYERSVSAALDESRLAENLEMVREGWLGEIEGLGEIAHAEFSATVINEVNDLETDRIRERL